MSKIETVNEAILSLFKAEREMRETFGPNRGRTKFLLDLLATAYAVAAEEGVSDEDILITTKILVPQEEDQMARESYFSLVLLTAFSQDTASPEEETLAFPLPMVVETIRELPRELSEWFYYALLPTEIDFRQEPESKRSGENWVREVKKFIAAARAFSQAAQEILESVDDDGLEEAVILAGELRSALELYSKPLELFKFQGDENNAKAVALALGRIATTSVSAADKIAAALTQIEDKQSENMFLVYYPVREGDEEYFLSKTRVRKDLVEQFLQFPEWELISMAKGLLQSPW